LHTLWHDHGGRVERDRAAHRGESWMGMDDRRGLGGTTEALLAALETSSQPAAVVHGDRHLWTNSAYQRLTGHSDAWLRTVGLDTVVRPQHRPSIRQACAAPPAGPMVAHLANPAHPACWASLVLTPLPLEPGSEHDRTEEGHRAATGQPLLVTAADLTDEREERDRLAHRALHDPLTGLPNRTMFLERLRRVLLRQARAGQGTVAVLFVDLDRIKRINDQYGHAAGDHVLTVAADRLVHAVRPDDVVARLGGDEFTILLNDVGGRAEAQSIAQRCLRLLAAGLELGEETISLGASIGVAVGDVDTDPEALVGRADRAMYQAKAAGRGRVKVALDDDDSPFLDERAAMEADLRVALERDQLRVHYQPIVDLTTGRVAAAEALLRWEHPVRGLLPAGAFITIAEESGLITSLGCWVVDRVIADLADWDRAGIVLPEVFVNVSVQQLADGTLVGHVRGRLEHHDVAAERLCLEITETEIMSGARVVEHIHALHALGCCLVVDDFGTGYSSLSRLIDLPVGVVKIDRSFITGVGEDPRATAVVSATLLLAHDLRQRAIAEGVETAEQLQWLVEAGCSFAQGFLLSRAVPRETLVEVLRRGRLGEDRWGWALGPGSTWPVEDAAGEPDAQARENEAHDAGTTYAQDETPHRR
jgi:diguanylate cyclase (GGDEF)-like protein